MMRYVKRALLCCLCLIMLCSAAQALDYTQALEQASGQGGVEYYRVFEPAPETRVRPGLIDGLAAKCTYENSELVITIDAEKTDWDTVVAKGLFSGSGEVYISPGFVSPTGESAEHRSSGFSLDVPEHYIIELMKREFDNDGYNTGTICKNGMGIGRYDAQSGLFQPVEWERHGLMCVWNVNGSLRFEYLVTTIRYTSTEPFVVKIPQTPAREISLLYDMPQADRDRITVSATNGNVLLTTEDVSLLSQQWGSVAVSVPEEAGDEAWTCYVQDSFGNGNETFMVTPEDYPLLKRRSAFVTGLNFDRQNSTDEREYMLEWYDENGELCSRSKLYIAVVTGDPMPWPYYVANWEAVDPDRLTIEKHNLPQGVDVVYDGEGLLTVKVDTDELPLSADYGRAFYRLMVAPPDESALLRGRNNSGGNDVFGAENALHSEQDQLQRTRDNVERYEPDQEVGGGNIFRTYHQDGSDLTVYMTSEMTGQFAGGVVLVSWWEEGADPEVDDPLLTEYIVTRQESCVRVLTSDPYEDENDLPDRITQPVIVIPQGSIQNGDGMTFVAQIYPQRTNNCMYYKLELVDEDGEPVKLEKGQYKVFLPYPEGLTEDQKNNINLRHLDDAHIEIENFSITGNTLHLAEGGIWFQAKSFSPFVLEWPAGGSGECGHPLGVESAFEDRGFAQFCTVDAECHLSLMELIVFDTEYTGEPYRPDVMWEGDEWQGEEPVIFYAQLLEEGNLTDPTLEPPVEVGDYIAFMAYEDLKTMDMYFRITEVGESTGEHRLVYENLPENDGFIQTCEDEECGHRAIVRLAMNDMFYNGEPVIVELEREGDDWLEGDPMVFFMPFEEDGSAGELTEEPPTAVGSYAALMVIPDETETDLQFFSIFDPDEALKTRIDSHKFTDADLSAALKDAGFATAWEVETDLRARMLEYGVKYDNMRLYDVKLMYQTAHGEWREITPGLVPLVNGKPQMRVLMDLPDGAQPDDEFVVLHMFADNAFGKTAGEVENPKAEVTFENAKYQLGFTLNGFSPVMVGWREAEVPVQPPKTGDDSLPVLWLALCAASALGVALTVRKRRANRG